MPLFCSLLLAGRVLCFTLKITKHFSLILFQPSTITQHACDRNLGTRSCCLRFQRLILQLRAIHEVQHYAGHHSSYCLRCPAGCSLDWPAAAAVCNGSMCFPDEGPGLDARADWPCSWWPFPFPQSHKKSTSITCSTTTHSPVCCPCQQCWLSQESYHGIPCVRTLA